MKMWAIFFKKELYYIARTKKACKLQAIDYALELKTGLKHIKIRRVLITMI